MENSTEHHSNEQELRQHRLDKLARIRARGDEPYKYIFQRSHLIGAARAAFEALEPAAMPEAPAEFAGVALAGRMTSFRGQGKTSFADLRDETGKIQVFLNGKNIGEEAYDALKDLDLGDFIGVFGTVKRTRTGEVTVLPSATRS